MNRFFNEYLGERRQKQRVPLERAMGVAKKVRRQLLPHAEAVLIAGSIRRAEAAIGDAELVVLPRDVREFVEHVEALGFAGGDRIRRKIVDGIKVEIYLAHAVEEMGAMLFWFTGDALFNTAMNARAKNMGYTRNQYGIWKGREPVLQHPDECEFFDFLGVDWHAPEERSLATRAELGKLLSALRRADISSRDRAFVEETRARLRGDRYLPPEIQLAIRRRARKYLGRGTLGLGAEELVELGAEELVELGEDEEMSSDKDWSPRRGSEKDPFPGMTWTPREFREPDRESSISGYIWYGPGGPDGEHATTVEIEGDGYRVCEYAFVEGLIENPPSPFLKTCAFVDFEFLAQALRFHGKSVRTAEEIGEAPTLWYRYAADVGVAMIHYGGGRGEEEWADSLP